MLDLVRQGVPLTELSAAVAYAATRRTLHFNVSNEFGDWDTVHHAFTYANAVDQAMRRAPSKLARARHLRRGDVGLPGTVPERAEATDARALRRLAWACGACSPPSIPRAR